MKTTTVIKALIKSIPGFEYVKNTHENFGGSTLNARYCYSVWLRHLVMGYRNCLNTIPKKIAELGPGDSLGVGIAALISGADKYLAFDVVKYQPTEVNLKIFDELVDLFRNRADIPNEVEFPRLKPYLESYDFPADIFKQPYLDELLDESRLINIRKSINIICKNKRIDEDKNLITYMVPWDGSSVIDTNSVDMILSQAVLQSVNNLEATYEAMAEWLKPQGLMSHQMDFTSLGSSNSLQGHWEYSDFEWKIIKARMKYYTNREPYSRHLELLKFNNFKIIGEIKYSFNTIISREKLAKRFENLTNEDLNTRSLFIQAIKD